MEAASAIHTATSMAKVVAIRKCLAMGDVPCVVIHHRPVMPVESPVAPSPPIAGEETQSESNAKGNSCSSEIEPRIGIPAGPHSEWCAIHEPRIVLRDVDNIRVYGFDRDRLPLYCYVLLRSAF
jgi:hypothetical protein